MVAPESWPRGEGGGEAGRGVFTPAPGTWTHTALFKTKLLSAATHPPPSSIPVGFSFVRSGRLQACPYPQASFLLPPHRDTHLVSPPSRPHGIRRHIVFASLLSQSTFEAWTTASRIPPATTPGIYRTPDKSVQKGVLHEEEAGTLEACLSLCLHKGGQWPCGDGWSWYKCDFGAFRTRWKALSPLVCTCCGARIACRLTMSLFICTRVAAFANAAGLFQRYSLLFSKGKGHIASFLSVERFPWHLIRAAHTGGKICLSPLPLKLHWVQTWSWTHGPLQKTDYT